MRPTHKSVITVGARARLAGVFSAYFAGRDEELGAGDFFSPLYPGGYTPQQTAVAGRDKARLAGYFAPAPR